MRNYLSLPAARAPDLPDIGNAFANVGNALAGYRQGMNQETARNDELDQRNYQRGRDAKQDGRVAENDKRAKVEWFGKQALAVDQLQGPMRAAAWQRLVSQHPDRGQLTPEYLDPMQGPKLVAAEAGQWQDPLERQAKELEVEKTRAEISKIQRDASAGGASDSPMNVREWEYYSRLPPDKQAQYLNMKRSIPYLNQETQFVKPDPVTGQPMATVPINNVEAKAQEELGTAVGKQAAAAPGDLSAADTALDLIDSLRADPNKAAGTAVYSPLGNMIPKTPGFAFEKKVEQAKSGAFLTAIQQLRGMGALSNAEGQTATSAVTRMSTATTEADFDAALADYEKIVLRGQRSAQKIMGDRERLLGGSAPSGAPQKAPAPGGWSIQKVQ